MKFKIIKQLVGLSLLCFIMAGCDQAALETQLRITPVAEGEQQKAHKSDTQQDAMSVAKKNFEQGYYGNAEKAFRRAVEENPKNAQAWLGLAATYDRLKKFQNANRAYEVASKLIGFTPRLLNNLGYHYILRGDLKKARKMLLAAQKKDPDNIRIQNNLDLLNQKENQ